MMTPILERVFQFQPGSIKGVVGGQVRVGAEAVFQFQPGSIKGVLRLLFQEHDTASFNSSLVLLKAYEYMGNCPRLSAFQFQPGSIKGSPCAVMPPASDWACFNSSLVLLKAHRD